MSIFRAIKKLGSATVQTALLPIDIALDSCGAPLMRSGNREGQMFSVDRVKRIGRDLKDAYEETGE
jgi:hypothetical protein